MTNGRGNPEPTTPNEACVLAEQDKYQFQWREVGLVIARTIERKKEADYGIDGKLLFGTRSATSVTSAHAIEGGCVGRSHEQGGVGHRTSDGLPSRAGKVGTHLHRIGRLAAAPAQDDVRALGGERNGRRRQPI